MALETRGLRFRETMAGYMSPAGSFRAGYRWGKVAGGDVRFTAAIAIPDLDTFLQDPDHRAPLTASLDYDGLGWGLPVKAGRFHLFCRRDGHTRMLYYLPFICSGQRYLLFGQKFVGDRPGLHVWRDLTSLHTQLLRLDESDEPVGEPLARGILTIGLPSVVRQFSTFRTFGAAGPLEVLSLYARFLNGCTRELVEAYRLPLPNQRALPRFEPFPPGRVEAPAPPPAQPAPPPKPTLVLSGNHISFDELVDGQDLGCMEYVLDEERVHRYLAATGADNPRYSAEAGHQRVVPPAILAADTLKLSGNCYRIPGGIQVGQRLELVNPPRVGKRITVRGRLAEKFRRKGRPFFVLESTAEDEDGRLLLRSRAVNLLSLEQETEDGRVEVSGPAEGRRFKQPSGQPLPPVVRLVNQEHMTLFEDEGRVSIHTDDDLARAHALPAAIAAGNHTLSFIVEMLHDAFGDDYLRDSVLDVRFVAPVYAGDRVRAGGVITQREPILPQKDERLTVAVWCENQRGRLVAAGTAELTLRSA